MKKEKAKRWGLNEGVKALRDGDVKARLDIASRFPMFATATIEEIVEVVGPEFMTVRQAEIRLKKKSFGEPVEDEKEDNDEEDPPDEKEDTPKDDIQEDTADEIFEIEKELLEEKTDDIPDPDSVEEVKAEVVKKPKEDITEDDLDDLFSDEEDIPESEE